MALNTGRTVFSGAVLAGCLAGVLGVSLQAINAADQRGYRSKTVTPPTTSAAASSTAAAPARGKRPTTTTTTTPEPPAAPMPKETELGEDHQANIAALQREKFEMLRYREDQLRRAYAAGQASQNQYDKAALPALRAELELQDRAPLRIIAMEKIVEILKRFEKEAEADLGKPVKGNSLDKQIKEANEYTRARIERINAQLDLERERAAQTPTTTPTTTPSPTTK